MNQYISGWPSVWPEAPIPKISTVLYELNKKNHCKGGEMQEFEKECQDLWQKVYQHHSLDESVNAEDMANEAVASFRRAFQPSFERRVVQWAKDRNIIGGSNSGAQLKQLLEEIGELAAGIAMRDNQEIKDGIGDASVVLCIIAALEGMTLQECLEYAWDQIKDRKGKLINGVFEKEEPNG